MQINITLSTEIDEILAGRLTGTAAAAALRQAHAELIQIREQVDKAARHVSNAETFLVYGTEGRGCCGFTYA
jgi:tRNA C32,U32 (ribose-2'-O)-methylase TrmJ